MQNPDAARPCTTRGTDITEREFLPGAMLEEKPLWAELYESVHDALFPAKLPPLELTSLPIPVPDRMATKTNPWAVGTATAVNGSILAMVLCLGLKAAINPLPKPLSPGHVDISDLNIFAPLKARAAGGGGGGGSNSLTDPMMGRTPKFEVTPILPPQIPLLANPRLAVDPAIAVQPEIKLPEDETMPNIGVRQSYNVSLASLGQGIHGGIGTGANGGEGEDNGTGMGPGRDRGIGGEIYVPGGAVSAPVPIVAPEAEFSDEARREKYQGVCMVSLIVDTQGNPQSLRVVRTLGMGLDEKALEAIRKYRFKPAMKDKKPVAARITIEVDFRLY